jgi:hypothetical protein
MKNEFAAVTLALGLAALPAFAQSSASYKLEEHVINAGGHPFDGGFMASANYRVRLDSIGEALVGSGFTSASYRLDASFGSAYLPPGEVLQVWFSDHVTLQWTPEKSAGAYNLYRDLMSNLVGGGYGDCHDSGFADPTAEDTDAPPAGDGWFYLVTVENRLGEEGTKGADSNGTDRLGTVCP